MRYRFRGVELKTENAAKSYRQASKWFSDLISRVASGTVVLDYGCGKFRYTIPLSRAAKSVCAVDSSHQLRRKQLVGGKRATLEEYATKYLHNVSVHEVDSRAWQGRKFDFILCANVLSVIPRRADRVDLLRMLKNVLRVDGRLLASTQFRNTYFDQWKLNPNAKWVRDGWFVKGPRGPSFYAIIPPKKLVELCRDAGFSVSQIGSRGETAFVFVVH